MRCSQCSRRNNDANRFCIFCAAPLHNKSNEENKIILPPQDISEALKGRQARLLDKNCFSNTVSPVLGLIVIITILILGSQYLIDHIDVYEIKAIEPSIILDK